MGMKLRRDKMTKTIQPIKTATQRTLNRIREHGPKFEIIKWEAVSCFENDGGWFVKSIKTNWNGWLPESEIMLID
jgi:hypothetical protein